MCIQVYLWGSLFAGHSDYRELLPVIVEKEQDVWLQNVCFRLVFWVFLISSVSYLGTCLFFGPPVYSEFSV